MYPNMTFFGQMISFAILVWFTMKFIWPPLNAAIEERQKKIAEGLAAAERSQKDLAQAQRANQIVDQAKTDAAVEATRQKAMADAEIVAAQNRAREDLRKQVSVLAVSGAEKLLRREIDANAHKALLDELAAQL